MSKYLLNKFLFTVDRDSELLERYRAQPKELVEYWESAYANRILSCIEREASTWMKFEDAEREALIKQDYVALFGLGAHPFLTLTLFIGMFERDYTQPLAFQLEYAAKLKHFNLPYPDIET